MNIYTWLILIFLFCNYIILLKQTVGKLYSIEILGKTVDKGWFTFWIKMIKTKKAIKQIITDKIAFLYSSFILAHANNSHVKRYIILDIKKYYFNIFIKIYFIFFFFIKYIHVPIVVLLTFNHRYLSRSQ